MGEFNILQRTGDGYFNATELLKQWNKSLGMKKELKHYFENNSSKELIDTIVEEENLNGRQSAYLATRGKNGGTWMHPILFVDFAMWINPKFRYHVLKFVQDQLIKYRHLAGDNFKGLMTAAAKFPDVDYSRIAKGLNWIVFGNHEKNIRNKATMEQLEELDELQKKLAYAIDMGLITSFNQLMEVMNRNYNDKHRKF